jgi:hypothetical protein
VDPLRIVKEVNVLEEFLIDFVEVTIRSTIDCFLLQLREETLDTQIVIWTSIARHAFSQMMIGEKGLMPVPAY